MANSKQENRSSRTTNLPKMKIFELSLKNFATFGVDPNLSLQPYPFNAKILICFVILGSYIICNVVFAFIEAKTFTEYTQSAYMCASAVVNSSGLVVLILNSKKIFQLINDLENLINTTLKYAASYHRSIYHKTVQSERKMSAIIIFVLLKLTQFCGFVPWTIYNFFIYFTTDLGAASFQLPLPIWIPFDWKNPFGVVIALAVQYIMHSCAIKIGASVIAFSTGLYLYGIAASEFIKQNLCAISKSIRSKTGIETKRKLTREQLIEYIKFDSRAKRLTHDASDILAQFITLLFLYSLATTSSALLIAQFLMVHHTDNLAILLIMVCEIVYAFGFIFISCETAQRVNLAFEDCNDVIDQFEWYRLPMDVQLMLPLIMQFAQQPVNVNCFGSVPWNRESFKYVIKKAYSYFTVLRKFYD